MPIRSLVALCLGGLVLLTSEPVHAQAAPATSFGLGAIKVPGADKAKTGKGLSFGRSVFHAGVSLEGGWDSNVQFASANDLQGPVSSAYLRVLPQLMLGSRPVAAGKRTKFAYNVALAVDYVGYLQKLDLGMNNHHLGASLGADMTFNPQGLVSFGLVEQFIRTNEPRAGQDGSVDRDYNSVGFDLKINKGLLAFLIGYRFKIDIFEQEPFSFARRMMHEAKFKATWRFFPQTSFWFMATAGYVDYFQDYDETQPVGSTDRGNRNSIPFRAMFGVTGRFARWMTADVGIGYGLAVYDGDAPDQFHHDVVAHAAVGFQLGPVAKLRLGYRHDFQDSLVGDFYKSDSAYLRFSLAIAQRFILGATLAYTRADYQRYFLEDSSCTNNLCTRVDNYLSIGLGADYYFLTWLSAGLGYTLMANVTDFNEDWNGSPYHPDFLKHRVYGRVTLFY